jgi:hypothetical protein
MLLEERIFRRVLAEGMLDSFANIIKRDMTEELKSSIDEINSSRLQRMDNFAGRYYEIKSSSTSNKGQKIDWTLRLKVLRAIPRTKTMFIEGALDFESNELEVLITINSQNGDFKPEFLQEINQRLSDVVRHEIEHFFQSEDLRQTSTDAGQKFLTNKSNVDARIKYYINSAELPAFVNGMINKAKQLSRQTGTTFSETFYEIVDDNMKNIVASFERTNPKSTLEDKKKLDAIKTAWINYAKTRTTKLGAK